MSAFDPIYKKTMAMKVLRTTHTITIRSGTGRQAIMDAMSNLPVGAKVTKIYETDGERNYDEVVIEFEEEHHYEIFPSSVSNASRASL